MKKNTAHNHERFVRNTMNYAAFRETHVGEECFSRDTDDVDMRSVSFEF